MAIKGYSTFLRVPELKSCNQMLFSVRVDLGVMAIKGYSTLHKVPELEPCNQMQFSVRVDLGVMAINEYSTLPGALAIRCSLVSYSRHSFF